MEFIASDRHFFYVDQDLDSMIRSVAREFNWLPKDIGSLFLDDIDYLGLEYWYKDILEAIEYIKSKTKPNTE